MRHTVTNCAVLTSFRWKCNELPPKNAEEPGGILNWTFLKTIGPSRSSMGEWKDANEVTVTTWASPSNERGRVGGERIRYGRIEHIYYLSHAVVCFTKQNYTVNETEQNARTDCRSVGRRAYDTIWFCVKIVCCCRGVHGPAEASSPPFYSHPS